MGILNSVLGAVKSAAPDISAKVGPLLDDAAQYMFKSGTQALKDGLNFKLRQPIGNATTLGEYASSVIHDQKTSENVFSGQLLSQIQNTIGHIDLPTRQQAGQGLRNLPEVDQLRQLIQPALQQANQLGAKTKTGLPMYTGPGWLPTVLKEQVLKPGELQNDFINHLVQSNQMPRVDAEQFVKSINGIQNGRKGIQFMLDGGGLQIPAKFKETDPMASFGAFSQGLSRYVTAADNFGPSNQFIKSIVSAAEAQGGSTARDLAANAFSLALYGSDKFTAKNYYQGVAPWEQTLKAFEGLTKLGRIGLAEPSQNLNTLIFTDIKSVVNALGETLADWHKATDFALKSGVLAQQALHDWKASSSGQTTWMDSMMHYVVDPVHKFNLILTANAAKHYVQDMAAELASNPNSTEANVMLKHMGLEPSYVLANGGQLSQADILFAARRATEITQFQRTPIDLPMAWNSNPWLRTATLYKSFAFNQAKFTKDFLFKNSIESGKYQNFAYAATLFPVVGELVRDAEFLAQGRDPRDRGEQSAIGKLTGNASLGRLADNYAGIGSIGMFSSILSAFNRGNIAQWLAGPVAGDLNDLGTGIFKLATGQGAKPLAKTLLNKIPVVGAAASNLATGGN